MSPTPTASIRSARPLRRIAAIVSCAVFAQCGGGSGDSPPIAAAMRSSRHAVILGGGDSSDGLFTTRVVATRAGGSASSPGARTLIGPIVVRASQ